MICKLNTWEQEVVEVYQQSLAGKVRGPPELKEPTNTLIEDYKAIYESMQGSDVTFKVSSDFIPCHKAILAAQSSELAQLCSVPPVKGKDGPEAIVLPPIKAREGKEVFTNDAIVTCLWRHMLGTSDIRRSVQEHAEVPLLRWQIHRCSACCWINSFCSRLWLAASTGNHPLYPCMLSVPRNCVRGSSRAALGRTRHWVF